MGLQCIVCARITSIVELLHKESTRPMHTYVLSRHEDKIRAQTVLK